ncbi:MAG: ydiC [Bacillales bacterium]|jgi:tRNA threonylcarbamoyladenosine biosynthesis protein TsaB|nr:ydiC [Bacillales bacterium]
MTTLVIDTSTSTSSVALTRDGKILAEYISNTDKNHSETLVPRIETLLKNSNIKAKQLSRIIVAKGPGSYTGVRIGVTVAKTLAWTLNIPLYSVSSLEVIASSIEHFHGIVIPIVDARRNTVYTTVFEIANGEMNQISEETHVSIEEWAGIWKKSNRRVLWIGSDVYKFKTIITEIMGDQAIFAAEYLNVPRLSKMEYLLGSRDEENIHAFVPEYAKLAEAEAKWLEAQNNK